MDQNRIGRFIADVRCERNMTQQDLADALLVSNSLISKWETGKSMPDILFLTKLCEVLGINVNELLAGEHIAND